MDSFIGPGATSAEVVLQFAAALAVGVCCQLAYRSASALDADGPSWQREALVFLIGIDMAGGMVTNATGAAKRWYHRSGQGFLEHMAFVALHAAQIGAVAYWFVDDGDDDDGADGIGSRWTYFAAAYGSLLAASAAVLSSPLYLQRPAAAALAAVVVPLSSVASIVPRTPGLGWFLPMLFVKILMSHLTSEVPFRPGDALDIGGGGAGATEHNGKTK